MEFSWGWFFAGLVIVAVGALIIRFHIKIADMTGAFDYSKWQIIGIVVTVFGFVLMLNLHLLVINGLVNFMFRLN